MPDPSSKNRIKERTYQLKKLQNFQYSIQNSHSFSTAFIENFKNWKTQSLRDEMNFKIWQKQTKKWKIQNTHVTYYEKKIRFNSSLLGTTAYPFQRNGFVLPICRIACLKIKSWNKIEIRKINWYIHTTNACLQMLDIDWKQTLKFYKYLQNL